LAIAREKQPAHISHWTLRELARTAMKRRIFVKISVSDAGLFLFSSGLEAHQTKFWLNHEVEDEAGFRQNF